MIEWEEMALTLSLYVQCSTFALKYHSQHTSLICAKSDRRTEKVERPFQHFFPLKQQQKKYWGQILETRGLRVLVESSTLETKIPAIWKTAHFWLWFDRKFSIVYGGFCDHKNLSM